MQKFTPWASAPEGQRVVTGSFDHDLRLWSVADGKEIARMTGHGDKVKALQWPLMAPSPAVIGLAKSGMWDRLGAGASGR